MEKVKTGFLNGSVKQAGSQFGLRYQGLTGNGKNVSFMVFFRL